MPCWQFSLNLCHAKGWHFSGPRLGCQTLIENSYMLGPNKLGHLLQGIRLAYLARLILHRTAFGPFDPTKQRAKPLQDSPNRPASLPGHKILTGPGPIITLSRTKKTDRTFH